MPLIPHERIQPGDARWFEENPHAAYRIRRRASAKGLAIVVDHRRNEDCRAPLGRAIYACGEWDGVSDLEERRLRRQYAEKLLSELRQSEALSWEAPPMIGATPVIQVGDTPGPVLNSAARSILTAALDTWLNNGRPPMIRPGARAHKVLPGAAHVRDKHGSTPMVMLAIDEGVARWAVSWTTPLPDYPEIWGHDHLAHGVFA